MTNVAALTTAAVGGAMVLGSYAIVFSGEPSGYTTSRFWLGLDSSTATALVPLQLLAAAGYLVFVYEAATVSTPMTGLLGADYLGGHVLAVAIATFSIASAAWPYATLAYLDARDDRRSHSPGSPVGAGERAAAIATAATLILAAASAIVMLAGAFEANLSYRAVVGVALFACTVVLLDGVGWNARLLHGLLNA